MTRAAPVTSVTLATLSAAILFGAATVEAAESGSSNGPYLRAFGGYSIVEDPKIQGDNISNGQGNGRGSMSLGGGFWGGAAGGYHFGVMRLEAMGSYESHEAQSFSSPQFTYATTSGQRRTDLNASPSLSGDVRIFTGFLNAIVDVDFGSPFRPFVGGGVGFANVKMDNVKGNSNGNAFNLADGSDTVLAFQALIGLAYRFTPAISAEIGYRYLTLNDPSFTDSLNGSFDISVDSHQGWLGLRADF